MRQFQQDIEEAVDDVVAVVVIEPLDLHELQNAVARLASAVAREVQRLRHPRGRN